MPKCKTKSKTKSRSKWTTRGFQGHKPHKLSSNFSKQAHVIMLKRARYGGI